MCVKLESQMSHSPGTARPVRQDLQGQTEADATSLCLCEATWTKLFPRWSHTTFESVKVLLGTPAFETKGFQFSHRLNSRWVAGFFRGLVGFSLWFPSPEEQWCSTFMEPIAWWPTRFPLLAWGFAFLCLVRHKSTWGGRAGTVQGQSAGTDCRAGAPWPLCSGFLWKCFKYCYITDRAWTAGNRVLQWNETQSVSKGSICR